MEDRDLMENLLLLEKGACDLYLHGTIEACTDNVHQTFSTALNSSLNMQDTVYSSMESRGWYAPENAQNDQINCLKNKFSSQSA